MVHGLTSNFVCFFKPLLSKSATFLLRAHRTISLPTVLFIKWMSPLARYFSLINCPQGIRIIKDIFCYSYKSKMFYRNTVSVFAKMVYNHTRWYRSVMHEVCNSVCTSFFLPEVEMSVSIFVKVILPKFAVSNFFVTLFKPFGLLFCNVFHVVHCSPYNTIHKYV
jgi:hypothetical protein